MSGIKITTRINPASKILGDRGLGRGGRVQQFVDSEVLRLTDPYVPVQTGALKKSGITGTVVGSGEVVYKAPHARRNYYTNRGRGKQGTQKGGLRGRYWFARMKADHGGEIIAGAKKIAGGK